MDSETAGTELSLTAYAVLGILSHNGELLTAGEIRHRAGFGLRFFFGSPAVSHIRRELQRMLVANLVEGREIPIGGTRRAQAFQTTKAGEQRLRDWVAEGGANDPVVVKNATLLRVFFGRDVPVPDVVSIINHRLDQIEEDLRTVVWGRGRALELGLVPHEDRRFSTAVSDYLLRSLHFERGNLEQLRDTIAMFDPSAALADSKLPRKSLRPRQPRD